MDKKSKLYIFSDFDGTVTYKDIGDEIFKEYGQFEPFNSQLKNREIDIKDYWKILCSSLISGTSEQTIIDYSLSADIDPWFAKLANYCKDNNIPISVLSDGFESYIKPVLDKLELSWIPVFCNKLIFNDDGSIEPFYPYASESCDCFCASCKRNSMLSQIPVDAIVVFIGDGYSDYCAAEHSDIIFAKKNLAAYCTENKIPHYNFSNFFDVYRILTEIIPKKQLKTRNQAKQLRNKAYETE